LNDERRLVRELARESEATVRDESPYSLDVVPAHRADTVVQSVRLNIEDLEEVRVIAARSGVPVGALLRGWIKEGLAAEKSASIDDSIERLAADLNRLRRVARGA
jgi:hypothetical protein